MNICKKTFAFGQHTVSLETGRVARQANSVMVSMGDTVVLVAAVGRKEANPGQSFFPLTVVYQERYYATGRIPGGFLKREGRPSEHETLTSRLIDRPIRPLFPAGFKNEVQVIATVISLDPEISADIPALIGASAVLSLSGMPFAGPIAGARVGYQNGQYILNPGPEALKESELNLVVAGTEKAVLMVESEAQELSEEIMLGAVNYGHEQMQVAIQAISEMVAEAGKPRWDWAPEEANEELATKVASQVETDLGNAYRITDKLERNERVAALRQSTIDALAAAEGEEGFAADEIESAFKKLEKTLVRERVLNNEPRIDGRDTKTVRDIRIEVGELPRAHGSALFTRGETQAMVVATLGTKDDEKLVDALPGTYFDRFMLHYNFPPYCVGETGFMGSPKRREIGHGRLARRGLEAVLPSAEDCPYAIRVVSEITESNGSSSMASICGTSLALMDAGIKIKAPVSGIAMGLVKDGDRYAILSDIMGDEDHLGDMDFKVAGTETGITALQMDIKIDGITKDIMAEALTQAQAGRLHILSLMNGVLSTSRQELSDYAPRFTTMKIHPDKIRDVIGKGGATIRALTEETGASIDIEQDGTIKIAAVDGKAADAARDRIEQLTADVEVGKIYEGPVARILDFGAIVNLLPGKDGMVHISQIAEERVENISDKLSEGQVVRVKVLEIDRQGRVRLTMKDLETA